MSTPLNEPSLLRGIARGATAVCADRRALAAAGALGAVWLLAAHRVFVDPTPFSPLLFNVTGSLPYTVAYLDGRRNDPHIGDYILYRFEGPATVTHPGLTRQPFFKRVRGVAGDVVTLSGRTVFVNGRAAGMAKPRTFDGHPLHPLDPTVIPPGHYYVEGTSADSFDSRYRESGLVRVEQVIGTVTPLF